MSSTAAVAKPEAFGCFVEVEAVIRGFEAGTLPRSEWTHKEHLVVACWYLVCHPEAAAVEKIRAGILRYNGAVGIVSTPDSGYHETMTLFWARMVKAFLRTATLECAMIGLFNELVVRLGDRNLPFAYYTRERLLSREARAEWREPDIQPLPGAARQE
ncbi:MAG: hypothetical protein SF339_11760 [Blastocatellia bacterium]|nr:hypothetical protein [Blastocatellia bacterium]